MTLCTADPVSPLLHVTTAPARAVSSPPAPFSGNRGTLSTDPGKTMYSYHRNYFSCQQRIRSWLLPPAPSLPPPPPPPLPPWILSPSVTTPPPPPACARSYTVSSLQLSLHFGNIAPEQNCVICNKVILMIKGFQKFIRFHTHSLTCKPFQLRP